MLTATLREMQSRSGTDKVLVTDTTSVYKLFRSYLANISPISNTWKCRASHNCSLSENCICHCWHIEPLDTLWRSTSMPWNSQINDGSIGSEIRCSLRSSGLVGAWHLNKIGVGFFGIGCTCSAVMLQQLWLAWSLARRTQCNPNTQRGLTFMLLSWGILDHIKGDSEWAMPRPDFYLPLSWNKS